MVKLGTMPLMGEEAAPGAVRQRLTKDERRTRILDAAAEVFAERGYDAASIDEIAEKAGITKPVIYDHFSSKRELHISLLEIHNEELLAFMAARVGEETTAEGRLEAGFGAFFEFVETHPYAWRNIMRDPTPADPEIVEAHRRVQERATAAIAALSAAAPMVEHPGRELDRDLHHEMIAVLLKTAANGLASWWYVHRSVPREQLVSVIMDAIWIGFERFAEGERWRLGPPPRP